MIISLLAIGSRGDVQPIVSLAAHLVARGHVVRLIAPDAYAELVAGRGVDFFPMGFDIKAEFEGADTRGLFNGGGSVTTYLGWLISVARRISMAIAPRLRECTRGSDVIVGAGFMQSFGAALSELSGAQSVNVWFWPGIASGDFLCSLTPPLPITLPKWLNRAGFLAADQLVWLLARPVVNQVRRSYGLPPSGWTPDLRRAVLSGAPLLLPYSESLLPRSSDWPANVEVTGYWRLDRRGGWAPPEDLTAFLAAGPAPVYIGFGSMAIADPEAAMAAILSAVRGAKTRAIVSAGWGRLLSDKADPDIFFIDEAPHDWLFPQMSAIVHHGGSGTTGSALRAGKPSVVVPFILDQFFWGEQLRKRGVAPPPIPYKKLTAPDLTAALRSVLADNNMRSAAATLGARIRAEDGFAAAVAAIERAGKAGAK